MSSKILADRYPQPECERRSFTSEVSLETRDDGRPIIRGYAAVYGPLSEDLGGFRERVMPGAFRASLANGADVRAFDNHDTSKILGRRSAGNLKLFDDDTGLRYEISPPDTSIARDMIANIAAGNIRESSFGFVVKYDSWTRDTTTDPETLTRDIVRADIFDVSPVTFPAYRDTSVALRSLQAAKLEPLIKITSPAFSLSAYLCWLDAIDAAR
jgi:uncharacterized protein